MHGVSLSQRQLIAGKVGLLFVVSVKKSSQTIDLSSICNTHVHFKLVLTIKICLRDNCKSLLTSCSLWGIECMSQVVKIAHKLLQNGLDLMVSITACGSEVSLLYIFICTSSPI